MPRIVAGRRLARAASRSGERIAELVDRRDVHAIEEVEGVGDDVELQPFAERKAPRKAHIPLEEIGHDEAVAAEIARATSGRRD